MRDTLVYRKSIRPGGCLILFFAGILAGILFVQSQKESALAGIFSEYFLNQYASLKMDYKRLFRYVGGYRCGQYLCLICCGTLAAAPLLFGGLLFLLGMTWGTMISLSTIRLGFKGVVICVFGLLPQLFFYLPAFGWIWMWFWQNGYSRKKYLLLAGVGFFFLFFGIISEVYLNPLILQHILRKL